MNILFFLIIISSVVNSFFIVRLYGSTDERVIIYFPKLDFSVHRQEVRKNSIGFTISYVVLVLSFSALYFTI